MQTNSRNGFTLLELTVVIGILTMLAATLVPVLTQDREKARRHTPVQTIRERLVSQNVFLAAAAAEDSTDDLDKALALLDQGDNAGGEKALKAIVAKDGRSTGDGANASYVLASAYRAGGDFQDALSEANALLSALPPATAASTDNDQLPTRSEVAGLIDLLQAQIAWFDNAQKAFGEGGNPALALDRQGRALFASGDADGAYAKWVQANAELAKFPDSSQKTKLTVEHDFLYSFPSGKNHSELRKTQADLCLAILRDPKASPGRQIVAMDYLDDVAGVMAGGYPQKATIQNYAYTWGALTPTFAERTASSSPAVARCARHILFDDAAEGDLNAAVQSEIDQDWKAALTNYELSIQYLDYGFPTRASGSPETPIEQLAWESRRSIPLMRSLVQAPKSSELSFLGVDRTIGTEWQSEVGHGAWVLFALHGADVAGGPLVLNKTFAYKAYAGDTTNFVRRWRDPEGYQRRTGDLALSDPLGSGVHAVSFLDDNGESYGVGAGPDVYVDLNIPPGRYIVSLPIHFSEPYQGAAHYGLFLFGGNGAVGGPVGPAVAFGTVAVKDEPGYARFAVVGPARYTLVVRREDSYNANVQALFVDPDLRYMAPPLLSESFSSEQLSAVTSAGMASLINRYQQGAANPQSQKWETLEAAAVKLTDEASVPVSQRTIAAYIAWRSAERSPLAAGKVADAFASYLALKYPTGT